MAGGSGFAVTGHSYDAFMGRYARPLAEAFRDVIGLQQGQRVLDVGCGPGALTGVLAEQLGARRVRACDPSASFVAACVRRHPGVEVRRAAAESLPYADEEFDAVLAQLVLHFVGDPGAAAAEIARVLRPGGVFAASVWDFGEGMQMLRVFWDAALALDPGAPDEASTMAFGREGELATFLDSAGFVDVAEGTLTVRSTYAGFEELWAGFCSGVGPAGTYCTALGREDRAALAEGLHRRLGAPAGPFTLQAVARYARGTRPR